MTDALPSGSSDPARRTLVGFGLDGAGLGPASRDGETRVTQGDDYVLMGGAAPLHSQMQDLAETMAQACRDEGTTLGQAPKELIEEILSEMAADDGPPQR